MNCAIPKRYAQQAPREPKNKINFLPFKWRWKCSLFGPCSECLGYDLRISLDLDRKKSRVKKAIFHLHWMLRISTLEAKPECYPHVTLIIDLHDVNILICLLMVNNYEKLTFLFKWKLLLLFLNRHRLLFRVKVNSSTSLHVYKHDMRIINNDTAINRMLSVKRDLVNWRLTYL